MGNVRGNVGVGCEFVDRVGQQGIESVRDCERNRDGTGRGIDGDRGDRTKEWVVKEYNGLADVIEGSWKEKERQCVWEGE